MYSIRPISEYLFIKFGKLVTIYSIYSVYLLYQNEIAADDWHTSLN